MAEDLEFRRDQEKRRRAGESSQYQRRFRRADGGELWVNVSASPIFDDDGGFAGSLSMIADISEQRDAEGRLRAALSGTVAAMGALVEMRDPYTAGHERRTAELVVAIARRARSRPRTTSRRWTSRRACTTSARSPCPAEILTRPGRLSQNEFTLVKAHPQVAYDILSSIDFGRPIAEVILQHHERLDGSGYPGGLKGDEILLEARILAVADVVEAMSSHRPYRPALGRRGRAGRDRRRRRPPVRRPRGRRLRAGVRRGLRLQELGRPARRAGRRGAGAPVAARRVTHPVPSFDHAAPARQLRRRRARRRGADRARRHRRRGAARRRRRRVGRGGDGDTAGPPAPDPERRSRRRRVVVRGGHAVRYGEPVRAAARYAS